MSQNGGAGEAQEDSVGSDDFQEFQEFQASSQDTNKNTADGRLLL